MDTIAPEVQIMEPADSKSRQPEQEPMTSIQKELSTEDEQSNRVENMSSEQKSDGSQVQEKDPPTDKRLLGVSKEPLLEEQDKQPPQPEDEGTEQPKGAELMDLPSVLEQEEWTEEELATQDSVQGPNSKVVVDSDSPMDVSSAMEATPIMNNEIVGELSTDKQVLKVSDPLLEGNKQLEQEEDTEQRQDVELMVRTPILMKQEAERKAANFEQQTQVIVQLPSIKEKKEDNMPQDTGDVPVSKDSMDSTVSCNLEMKDDGVLQDPAKVQVTEVAMDIESPLDDEDSTNRNGKTLEKTPMKKPESTTADDDTAPSGTRLKKKVWVWCTTSFVLLLLLSGAVFAYFNNNTDPNSKSSIARGTDGLNVNASTPSSTPTWNPTNSPSHSPSFVPTISGVPTVSAPPSDLPSLQPSNQPTMSAAPSDGPSNQPSSRPSISNAPSDMPSPQPSKQPTISDAPSSGPTSQPSSNPTSTPSTAPSRAPIMQPSKRPTTSNAPSNAPSTNPTSRPTVSEPPSTSPTDQPSRSPSAAPSSRPSVSQSPTKVPSKTPTRFPTISPSNVPTMPPTLRLTARPTPRPTRRPTPSPTVLPPRPDNDNDESRLRNYLENDLDIFTRSSIGNQAIVRIAQEAKETKLAIPLTRKTVQRFAMLSIELALFGNSGGSLGGFGQDECSWTGIACNGNQEVTHIRLLGKGLQGSIPGEIGLLKSLVHLNLATNNLKGRIPEELWECRSLRKLFLYQNRLSGTISDKVVNLWELLYLNLSDNQLTGPIPKTMGPDDRGVFGIRKLAALPLFSLGSNLVTIQNSNFAPFSFRSFQCIRQPNDWHNPRRCQSQAIGILRCWTKSFYWYDTGVTGRGVCSATILVP